MKAAKAFDAFMNTMQAVAGDTAHFAAVMMGQAPPASRDYKKAGRKFKRVHRELARYREAMTVLYGPAVAEWPDGLPNELLAYGESDAAALRGALFFAMLGRILERSAEAGNEPTDQ